MLKITLTALVFLLSFLSSTAQWWSPVSSGIVHDIRSFAYDSINDVLYAGGDIDSAGGSPTTHVVQWDGINWSPVGTGFDEHVDVLKMFGGDLWAGGDFNLAPGNVPVNFVAKWNGTAWSDPGGGTNGFVYSMAEYNGQLYIGGQFTMASGSSAPGIARWSGTAWQDVGGGISGNVQALAVYNGELYAGGLFSISGGAQGNFIARWNGTSWSQVGTGMDYRIFALKVFNGELYAGGSFMFADGLSAPRVAKWNGTNWSPVGSGLTGVPSTVAALEVYNGNLYAGGYFNASGSNSLANVAMWNGTSWVNPGGGVSGGSSSVLALGVYRGELYAGGLFTNAGTVAAENVARWNVLPPVSNFFANDTVICPSSCIDFYDISESSPSAWEWTFQGASTGSSTAQHPQAICYSAPGIYTVKLKVTNILGSDSLIFTSYITVEAGPDVNVQPGDTAICQGETIALSVPSQSGANYQWFESNVPIIGSTANSINVSGSGNYHIAVVGSNGCSDTSLVVNIQVNPLPATPTITHNFDTLFASGSSVSYQWYLNGVLIPGATGPFHVATQNGQYTVAITDSEGCSASSLNYPFTSVGIAEFNQSGFSFYPNPASNLLHISIEGSDRRRIQIKDVSGRIVLMQKMEPGQSVINIETLSNGLYLLTDGKQTSRLVVM